ncbi:hypothetical protein ATANTOWER_022364 [Ataeniobius toweri]|uniref:Secreted protein n=1 Tax=Ataeniobius toweri TaxID=208326 RepID=A0ABU7C003_9TELE|nr:hypothetical protein [Ataeniobius toweri]
MFHIILLFLTLFSHHSNGKIEPFTNVFNFLKSLKQAKTVSDPFPTQVQRENQREAAHSTRFQTFSYNYSHLALAPQHRAFTLKGFSAAAAGAGGAVRPACLRFSARKKKNKSNKNLKFSTEEVHKVAR